MSEFASLLHPKMVKIYIAAAMVVTARPILDFSRCIFIPASCSIMPAKNHRLGRVRLNAIWYGLVTLELRGAHTNGPAKDTPHGLRKQPYGYHDEQLVFHACRMPELDDKKAFAARLKQALKRSSKRIETATELATQFNLRHPIEPITPQAAQKWLSGTARPTVDKIRTLADWLDVSEQWLRYGVTDMKRSRSAKGTKSADEVIQPTAEELELLRRLRGLSAYRRQLVEGVIEQFSLDGEVWKE